MFVDYVEIEVVAGNGGPGCLSFHTEKYMPRGGPDGGDGGSGGDVIAVADRNLSTLLDFRYRRHYQAANGQPGQGSLKTGKSGDPIRLRVPVGTMVKELPSGQMLCDFDEDASEHVIARGGRGGRGNAFFKSPTNQSPRKTQPGEPGEKRRLALELKLLADVGLVGMPNAGKSTILAALSAARPKIADYPFTTVVPHLGIVAIREYRSFVMADIPGLIDGAAQGRGLGHTFLKHIQRTAILVYVIDINEVDIIGTRQILCHELAEFDRTLPLRPSLTVITKIDTLPESDLKEVSEHLPPEYIFISAVAGTGTGDFLRAVELELDKQRDERTTN
jgi:GTP-binding protein